MTTVTEASILLSARRDPASGSEIAQLNREMNSVAGSTRALEQSQRAARDDVRALGAEMRRTAQTAQQMGAATTRAGRQGLGSFSAIAQQAGFQIGDFAVQVSAGTSAIQAFTQQAPQFLGFFGGAGAIAGAAVAVLGGLGGAYLAVGEDADESATAIERATSAMRRVSEIRELTSDLDKLREKYGELTADVVLLNQELERQARGDALRALRDQLQELREFLPLGQNNSVFAQFGLRDALGVEGSAFRFNSDLAALRRSILAIREDSTLDEQATAAAEVRDRLLEAVGGVEGLNANGEAFLEVLASFEANAREGANRLNEMSDNSDGVAKGIRAAADEAADLANQLERARDELASFSGSASSRLAVAQIGLEFRTDPVGRARATAELEASAALQRARDAFGENADPVAVDEALSSEFSAARQAIADRAEAARLDQLRRERDRADRERDRSRNRRGGGRRSARSRRDVAADIQAEITAIERRNAAEREGVASLRQALVLEAQEQALRRAGLSLSDLTTGANQRRAKSIADASAALLELQSAEAARSEIARAFATEVGQSYVDQLREIDRWREETLAALDVTGEDHERYAAQVEEVFQGRLKDAYDRDLDRREDWAAGVERAMRDITGATTSMADLSEEITTRAFQSMEDAFVSLATTGKLEVQDLVEFSLRQFFRLAQAAAVDLAGGGGGGSFIGGLLRQFAPGALSALGLGGGTSFTLGGGSGFTSTLSPGNFTFTSASVLHGGGMKRDAASRMVPLAAFDHAPRFHQGRFGPGEFPAVLEDTERVLTRAQQDNTARTIEGLANLASRPVAAAPSEMPITVNVYGGQGQPEVSAAQDAQGGLTIDVIVEQIEGQIGQRLSQGRGLAPAIERRYQIRPRGAL